MNKVSSGWDFIWPMNKDADDRENENFDDEDNLSVPAGPVRVVLGLMLMVGGVVVAALSDKAWLDWAGIIMFLSSAFVMLKKPDKRNEN
ncbi:MAG TPA: hypothetical protein VF658_17960 [Pyrinomonadaceae bacterium]|jgi:hypothetical protein